MAIWIKLYIYICVNEDHIVLTATHTFIHEWNEPTEPSCIYWQGGDWKRGSGKRESVKNAGVEKAGVEIMAPEYRGGKRERSDYGKQKFT